MYSRILLRTLVLSLLALCLQTAILHRSGMSNSIIRSIISSNSFISHQLLFRYLLKIIIPIMLLKFIINLSSSNSSHRSMAHSSHFSILHLKTHMLNTSLHLNHTQVAHSHHISNGKVLHRKRSRPTMVGPEGVVVAVVRVVVGLRHLLWALLFVWVLVMADRVTKCLKRAMAILHLTRIHSIVLQFHSLSLLTKAIPNKTFLKEAGRHLIQIHSILMAQIEAEEGFNIVADAI